MIFLEYTEDEKEKRDNLFTNIMNISSNLDIVEYDSKSYEAFIRKVEERQKIYFENNINSLVKIIKASLPKLLKILNTAQENFTGRTFRDAFFKLTNFPFRGIEISGYQFTFTDKIKSSSELREEIFNAYSYQINLVKEKLPERYEEILKFINDTLEGSTLIKTRTFRAKELKLDRSKPNKAIRDGREELYSETGLDVATGHKKNKSIYTPVLLNFVSEEELKKQGLSVEGIGHLDAFDAEVLMHAESLYEVGNKIMTVDMITTQMAGGSRRIQTTPKMKEEIYKSLMRLRLTNITIKTENEEKAGYNKHTIFSGVLLPNKIESETAIINGKQIEEYIHIFDVSPLSKYADSKNQISRPPVNMLDVPASLTRENIMLVGYLARRIVDMQSPDEWRGKYIIRYDTIFEYLKIEANSTQSLINKKNKIRQTVRAILEEWKRKDIINDFQELGEDDKPPKSRAPIAKIKITMPLKKVESDKNQ